jgi:hypothetical protein
MKTQASLAKIGAITTASFCVLGIFYGIIGSNGWQLIVWLGLSLTVLVLVPAVVIRLLFWIVVEETVGRLVIR